MSEETPDGYCKWTGLRFITSSERHRQAYDPYDDEDEEHFDPDDDEDDEDSDPDDDEDDSDPFDEGDDERPNNSTNMYRGSTGLHLGEDYLASDPFNEMDDETFKTTFNEAERDIRTMYHSVLVNGDFGIVMRPLVWHEKWSEFHKSIVDKMVDAFHNHRARGVKAYIASLRKETDPRYKRLLEVVLNGSVPSAGTLLSDVEPRKIPWLWYPRLALGKITTLDGDPGLV